MSHQNPAQPPALPGSPQAEQGDATGGVIPYKNPHALTAYYLGIFSLIPLLGFLLSLGAVPLGISGLKQRKKRPAIRGGVHAWIGIVLGSLSFVVHVGLIAVMVYAAASRRH